MVSDDKYEAVNSRDWYVTRLKGENQNQSFRYDIRSCTTKEEQADGWPGHVSLNRFILSLKKGDKRVGDHINSWLDNTNDSLRIASNRNNIRYQKKRSNKKYDLPKGVIFVEQSGKYRATIKPDGKKIHLGYFSTPEEAHEAYKVAAVKYYGEFARFE
jgi:hypothetical protein